MKTLICVLLTILAKCEAKNTTIDKLIYKGYGAEIHQYSFAAFLHLESTRPASCGASLIMVQAVVTAAYCVDVLRQKRGNIHAYFGATVPKDSIVVRRAVNYRASPKYNEANGRNNIAIVFLDRRVPLRHEIKKIPLVAKDPPVGSFVFSAGWGKQKIDFKLPDFSKARTLKVTKQRLISRDECTKYAGYKLSTTTMCSSPVIGHNMKDDAGNGLIYKEPSHVLVGVLSFISNDITIYTSVLAHRDWIIQTCRDLYQQTCIKKGRYD